MISELRLSTLPPVAKPPTTDSGTTGASDASRPEEPQNSAVSSAGASENKGGQGGRQTLTGEDIRNAVRDANQAINDVHRDLVFRVDDATKELVVKVMDRATGQVVRQIPSEEMLALAKRLQSVTQRQNDGTGVFVKDQA